MMSLADDFHAKIDCFFLCFLDTRFEKEYRENIFSLTMFNNKLTKHILLGYSAIMILITVYFAVVFSLDDRNDKAINLIILIIVVCLVTLIEYLFTYCGSAFRFRGVLATITPFIIYQVLLNEIDSMIGYPVGDFGIVAIISLSGTALCYNWLVAFFCYSLALIACSIYGWSYFCSRYGTLSSTIIA